MKCLDITFIIDFLQGKIKTKKEPFIVYCTTQINVYEVFFGIHKRNKETKSKELEIAEQFFNDIIVLPLTNQAVRKAAEIAGTLVGNGKEIGQNDCMTAAIALTHGINIILTQDVEHFRRIKGISVEKH